MIAGDVPNANALTYDAILQRPKRLRNVVEGTASFHRGRGSRKLHEHDAQLDTFEAAAKDIEQVLSMARLLNAPQDVKRRPSFLSLNVSF